MCAQLSATIFALQLWSFRVFVLYMTTIWDSLELWILSIVFVVWIGLKGPSIFFFGAIGAFGSTGVHSRQRVQDFVIAQVWVISLFVFICCVQFYSLSEYSHSMLLSFLLYLCFSLEIVMYMEKRKEEVIVQENPILPVWFVFQNTLFQSRFVFFLSVFGGLTRKIWKGHICR